ncbi:MAG: orotidine-5'-phosphate decarboxylase [Minisyncoccia bacterium]
MRNFRDLLEAQWAKGKFVCVGLDSELGKIPESAQVSDPEHPEKYLGLDVECTMSDFNESIVSATRDLVCAYKPNLGFYIAYGAAGLQALWSTCNIIRDIAPDVPVILDAKSADIGNTNVGYAQFAFEYLGVDAITVNPYLGGEALQSFLDYKNKGIFVLCRTSNPGADEFQDLVSAAPGGAGYRKLYQHVACQVLNKWNKNGNCGLVIGATRPDELREIRDSVGDTTLLIPGIGAQGGDLEKTVKAGKDSRGRGMIINSSRVIIFASNGHDFADAAYRETLKLNDLINQYLN